MSNSHQNGTTKRTRPALAVLLGSAGLLLACQVCRADLPSGAGSATSDWNQGPATSALGTVANLGIPQGFKFMDATAAGAFLQRQNQPVPGNLLGLLAADAEQWWIVLQFEEIGYVKNPAEELRPDAILSRLRAEVEEQNAQRKKEGLPEFSGVAWELKPQYDQADHSLGYAVRKISTTQSLVYQTVRVFCRRGAVDATVVCPYQGYPDLAPVRTLVKKIGFKAGERYEDYQAGDKACGQDLAALVVLENAPAKGLMPDTSGSGTASLKQATPRWVWVGGSVFACVGLLGGVLVLNRSGRRRAGSIRRVRRAAVPSAAPVATAAPMSASPVATPAAAAAAAQPAPISPKPAAPARPLSAKPLFAKQRPAQVRTNGKPVNGKRHSQQRRKVFDYNRYFTDLMGAVSSHSTQMDLPPANGVSLEPTRPVAEFKQPEAAEPAPAAVPNSHAQLLASQRELIEEQKRLIQEQSKLIEEKTRLIAEKNALLRMQSQMIEDKLL